MEPKTLIKKHRKTFKAVDQRINLALIALLRDDSTLDYFAFRDKAAKAIRKEMQGMDVLVRAAFYEMVELAREKSSLKGSQRDLTPIIERRAAVSINYLARRNVVILNRCMAGYNLLRSAGPFFDQKLGEIAGKGFTYDR